MELEVLECYFVEGGDSLEDHKELIDKKVKELEPEYYTVKTDLIRLLWRTTITVMEAK